MQKNTCEGLKIHASIRPETVSVKTKTDPGKTVFTRKKKTSARRAAHRLNTGDRLARNAAISCALLLGILSIRNIDQPWSHLALNGIKSALTMEIDLDDSLGKLSFVRKLVPESALVFLDITAQEAFAPVEGTILHKYSKEQPWILYQCPSFSQVYATEPASVSAVTRLNDGDWGVLLDHGGGIESVYAYLEEVAVRPGDSVSAGEVIGHASKDSNACIYFEMRKNGESVDPSGRLSF